MAKLGNFDLKFAGATIICDNEKRIEALRKYVKGESGDYAIDDVGFSESINQVEEFLYNTTYFHECRHVHDHLLCPILNYNYRLRLFSIFYAVHAANAWNKIHNYTYLPLPFKDWITLNAKKQKQLLTLKGINEESVPMYSVVEQYIQDSDVIKEMLSKDISQSDDVFGDFLVLGAAHYETYSRTTRPSYDKYGVEYSVLTILESMAFVHQATAMALKYGYKGQEACQFLVQHSFDEFMEGKRAFDEGENTEFSKIINYTSVFTFLYRYFYSLQIDNKYLYPFVSHVLYWSFNGNLLDAKAICSPIERLRIYTEKDFGKLLPMDFIFEHPLESFATWDKAMGSSPIDYTHYYDENLKQYIQLSVGFSQLGFKEMAEYTKMIGLSTYEMSQAFLSNPSNYLDPEKYLNNIYSFVNVPVRFKLGAPLHLNKESTDYLRTGIEYEGRSVDNEFVDISTIYIDLPRFSLHSTRQFIQPPADSALLRHNVSIQAENDINFAEALFSSDQTAIRNREMLVKNKFEGIKTWNFKNTERIITS